MSDLYQISIPVKVSRGEGTAQRRLELHISVWAEDAQAAVDQLAENLRSLEDHLHNPPDSQ